MKPFYLNGMLRSLVFALVGIFTPVFLYKLGIEEFGAAKYGIMLVAGYYIVMRITTLAGVIPISWIIKKIGFRRSIAISLLILAINLGSLLFAGNHFWLVLVSAIAGGLNIPFYWVARSSAISQDSDKVQVGRQLGNL